MLFKVKKLWEKKAAQIEVSTPTPNPFSIRNTTGKKGAQRNHVDSDKDREWKLNTKQLLPTPEQCAGIKESQGLHKANNSSKQQNLVISPCLSTSKNPSHDEKRHTTQPRVKVLMKNTSQ